MWYILEQLGAEKRVEDTYLPATLPMPSVHPLQRVKFLVIQRWVRNFCTKVTNDPSLLSLFSGYGHNIQLLMKQSTECSFRRPCHGERMEEHGHKENL